MQVSKLEGVKGFDFINIFYKNNSKINLENYEFKDSRIEIYSKNNQFYINIGSNVFRIFLNEEAQSIEILDYSNQKLFENELIYIWTSKRIEKKYIGLNFDKIPFLNKKEISIETGNRGLHLNVEVEKENNIYLVKDKNKILGKINDSRLSATIDSLSSRKNLLILKDNILNIYFLNEIIKCKTDNVLNIIIKSKNEKSFNRIKRSIEFGSRISNEVWIFLSKSSYKTNDENKSEFIIHILDKAYFCDISKNGLIIKEECRNYRKNDKDSIYAMVISSKFIKYFSYEFFESEDEYISEDLNYILESISKDESEFIKLINKYKNIELDILEEKKKESNKLMYNSIQHNIFYIEKTYLGNLESWNRNVGSYVAIETKKSNDVIGSLKNVYEDRIEIEFESDITRSILSKKGMLIIDTKPSEVMQNRRKNALDKLNKGISALADLKYMLSGEYSYSPYILKKKIKKEKIKDMNKHQIKAIENALNTNDLFLIQGPPGTGKTTVIRSIVENAIRENSEVLISSFQNLAVDNVLDGLLSHDILPFRFHSKFDNSDSMKVTCNEIVNEISNSINKNISRGKENNLIIYKENLNSIKGAFLKEIDIERKLNLIKEILEIVKEFKGENSTFNGLKDVLKNTKKQKNKNKNKYNFSKKELLELIPEKYLPEEEVYDGLKNAYEYARKASRNIENLRDIVEKLERLSDVLNFFDLNEIEFENDRNFIANKLDEIKCEDENTDIELDENLIISILNSELESLPEFVEDEKYEIIDEFVNKINNSPTIIEDILKKYADIKGTTCQKVGSKAFNDSIKNIDYSYVIIDEAARANPLDLIIPMVRGEKIILVGDHKQLPHIIESYVESKFELDEEIDDIKYKEYIKESLFGRLYEILPKDRKIMLDTQYRMTKEIGDLVSDLFYDGNLKTGTDIINDTPLYSGKSLVGKNIFSTEKRNSVGSYINKFEAYEIIQKLSELNEKNANKKNISVGVISFYKAQADFIKNEIKKREKSFENIELSVGTVDSYQGLEKEIIFISTVRSKGIGFTSNKNRLNVALSRAKKLIVIFSNKQNMIKNETFRKIFERCYWEEDICI